MVLVVALVVRVAFDVPVFRHTSLALTPDARSGYVPLAHHLGDGYLHSESRLFEVGLYRTPAYPTFLGILFGLHAGIRGAVVVQAAIGALTVLLTYLLGLELAGTLAALFAAAVVALEPSGIAWSGYLQPEALFSLLFLAGILLWARALRRDGLLRGLAAGIALGIAAITRPIGAYAPPLLVVGGSMVHRASTWRRRALVSAALLAGFGLVAGGWLVRNYVVADLPALGTIENANLLEYRAAGAVAEDKGIALSRARKELLASLERRLSPRPSVAERNREERALAISTLRHHLRGATISWAKGAARLVVGPARDAIVQRLDGGRPGATPRAIRLAVLGLAGVALVVTYLTAALGTVLAALRRRVDVLMILGVPLIYVVVLSAGPQADARFRVPMLPFLAILSGIGGSWVVERLRQRRRGGGSAQEAPARLLGGLS